MKRRTQKKLHLYAIDFNGKSVLTDDEEENIFIEEAFV